MGPEIYLFGYGSRATALVIFLVLLTQLLSSCARVDNNLVEIGPGSAPLFIDDESPASLIEAIDRHLDYLENAEVAYPLTRAKRITSDDFSGALKKFKSLLLTDPDPLELNRLVRSHFRIYRSTGRNGAGEMLVTGYYEPMFEGSLERTPPYLYPLYGVPDSLVIGDREKNKTGRIDVDGRLVPYWTRRKIESGNLLQGSELVWLKDRLDAYLLQVQGSGRIQLPDGSSRALHFAAANGLAYRSLGKLFVDEQLMTREEVSIDRIRAYFSSHPEELERMLYHNPRYIFFKWGDDKGPRGSLGQVLTAQRSVAIDHEIFPTGALGYLVSSRPIINQAGSVNHWKPFGRFVLPQDSGAAVKGAGRVDLFWGSDYYAEKAAGTMKEAGSLFFLLPRISSVEMN